MATHAPLSPTHTYTPPTTNPPTHATPPPKTQMTGRSPAYSRLDALRWLTHIAAACAYLHETCRPMVIHR